MSWRTDLGKLRACSWRDCGLLLEALLWLALMRAAIVVLPFRRISGFMGLAVANDAPLPAPETMRAATLVCRAVSIAGARTPWSSTCLVQALAGAMLLKRRGVPASLCLGVAKDAAPQSIVAHAWLRCGDAILLGADGVSRFNVISTFAPPASRAIAQ